MKKILLMCLSLLLFASALVSCEEWTEPESKVFLKGDGHDDAYYAARQEELKTVCARYIRSFEELLWK